MPPVIPGEFKSRDGGVTVDKDGNILVDPAKEGLPMPLLSSSFIPEANDVGREAAVHFVHEHVVELPGRSQKVVWLYRIPVSLTRTTPQV